MNATEAKINRVIGARMREARLARGLSLKEAGQAIGMSYQALQKYERGSTVIPVGRLAMLAEFMGMTIEEFFEGTSNPSDDTQGARYRLMLLMRKLQSIERSDAERFRAICELIGPTINSWKA